MRLKNRLGDTIHMGVKQVSKAASVLIIKYAMTFILAVITLGLIDRNPWSWVLAVSITAATLNYLLGDFYLMPRFGNAVTSAANGVLAVLTAYIADFIIQYFRTGPASLAAFGVLVAVGEYFFHRYFMRSGEVRP